MKSMKTILAVLMVTVLAVGAVSMGAVVAQQGDTDAPTPGADGDIDCGEFDNREQIKQVYNPDNDEYRLDSGDEDKIACENVGNPTPVPTSTSNQAGTSTTTTTATETTTETATATETTTSTQTATPTEAKQTGGNLTAAEIVKNARQSYDDIHSFNATVVSSTSASNGSGAIGDVKIKAKLSFEKPNNIRFEFLAPEKLSENVVISNGTTTILYNAANNTYRTFSFNGSMLGGKTMNLSQTGYLGSIERTLTQSSVTYEGTATVAGEETYVLSVEPTGLAANFTDNVTFYLDQDTYLPVKRVVHASFSFGNEATSFTATTMLHDVKVNVDIPEKVFEFNPPEDAQRIEGILSNVSTTSYDTIEQAQQNTDIKVCEPSQIPDGYSLTNVSVSNIGDTTSVTLQYTNDSGSSLTVAITKAPAGQQTNRSTLGESVTIDGHSGTYIEVAGQGTVTFTSDGLQYTVTGPFSQDELVSIAGSIDCAEDGNADGANDDADAEGTDDTGAGDEDTPEKNELGENDEDDDGDGAIDEDDEDNEGPSNDDDDGDGAIDEDDEPDDGDDGSDNFNGQAEDDDDGDGAIDEDDEPDSGNSDDVDNDGDGAVDEDDEPDTDD